MSGIFLDFRPGGFSDAERAAFHDRVAGYTTRIDREPVDPIDGPFLCAASSHHGVLPTGGVAKADGAQFVACGSAWIRPEDARLATPAQLLAHFQKAPRGERRALGGVCVVAHARDRERELVVESDRWGCFPLYYRLDGDRLRVASELKFLAEPGHGQIDEDALVEFLGMGFLPRPHTLLRGVRRLPGNARLVFGPGGLEITHFPSTQYTRDREVTDDVIDQYDEFVRRYLGRFAGLAPRYCISVSGGLDSRLVAAAALRAGFELDPFTVGEPGTLDVRMARRICRRLGLDLSVHEVRGRTLGDWFAKAVWFTEGRVMPNHMHYFTAHFTGETPPGPQLHGLMGETVMGGHYDDSSLLDAGPEASREACRKLAKPLDYWPAGARAAVYGDARARRSAEAPKVAAEELFERMGFVGGYSDFLDFRFRFKAEAFANPCIIGQVLPWSDVINPFMDPDAFAFGASLRLDGIDERAGQIRWGLRHLPVIGELPRVKAGVLLDVRDPDPEAYRRAVQRMMRRAKANYLIGRLSRGRVNRTLNSTFPEYGTWYRRWRPVREFVDGVLLSEQTLDRGIFRREGVRRLLHDLRTGRNTWDAIGTCLTLEIFLRQFVDGTDRPSDPRSPFGMQP